MCWWRSRGLNPGLSACKADALPLSYTPLCIQDAVKRAGLMNPKPRSFQRQAVPVTRSPVPSPILPRVGDRLGPRRGERPRAAAAARRRPRAAARWAAVEAGRGAGARGHGFFFFGPRARQKQCFGDSLKLAYIAPAGPRGAREGAARAVGHADPLETLRYVPWAPLRVWWQRFLRRGLNRRRRRFLGRSGVVDATRVAFTEASRGLAGPREQVCAA